MEIIKILSHPSIEFLTYRNYPDIVPPAETGMTFKENALIKARHAFAATGIATLADDSGLEVDWLDGEPGIYSARYAGEGATDRENLDKLLGKLTGIPSRERQARFRCTVALVAEKSERTSSGACEGHLINQPRGSSGFGYDPIFVPDGYSETFAELPPETKNQISHRAKALLGIRNHIAKLFP